MKHRHTNGKNVWIISGGRLIRSYTTGDCNMHDLMRAFDPFFTGGNYAANFVFARNQAQ